MRLAVLRTGDPVIPSSFISRLRNFFNLPCRVLLVWLLLAGGTLASAAPIGTINRFAGGNSVGFGGDGGAAVSAQLYYPPAVTVNSTTNDVYISDYYNYRVRKVTASGVITTVAGTGTAGYGGDGGASTSANVYNVTGLAIDRQGNLYLADQANQRIRKVNATTGIITTVAGNGTAGYGGDGGLAIQAQLNNPTGVAVDGADNVYIADQGNHRIRVVDAATGKIRTAAGNGTAGSGGDGESATGAGLYSPYSVALDSFGNLYICDYGNHAIRKVAASSGIITTYAGKNGAAYSGDGGAATAATLYYPAHIAIDGANNLYIADYSNHRIRKVAFATGVISTEAGVGSPGNSGDGGLATAAALNYPSGVAVDGSGNLYIADTNNHAIRMVNPGPATASAAAFTDNGDGTLTHRTTGLTWKRCAEGMAWGAGTCSGTAQKVTWNQAKSLSTTFAGKSDWRLPTIGELLSIVDYGFVRPAVDGTLFPGIPQSYAWSATPAVGFANYGWVVDFASGVDLLHDVAESKNVLMVRGTSSSSASAYTPSAAFTDNADGTVTHKTTGLTWKRCAEGQTWSGTGCSTAAQTFTWSEAAVLTQTFAGSADWRLPSLNELQTIVEWANANPAFNAAVFPSSPSDWLWSASLDVDRAGNAWGVMPATGANGTLVASSGYHNVRLVRGLMTGATSGGGTPVSGDTTAPSVPAGLSATAAGSSQINLSWSAATDDVGVTAYKLYRNGGLLITLGNVTSTSDTGLSAATTYSYTVAACDAAGNCSAQGTAATAQTNSAAPALSSLAVSCPASLLSGAGGSCSATAGYVGGTSNTVAATWSVSDAALASIGSNGQITAAALSAPATVVVTASYSENGVSRTATASIAINIAGSAALNGLTVSCPASLTSGASGSCSATAGYADGTSSTVAASWSVSDATLASIGSNGQITAATVSAPATVTVTASYSENGVSRTATASIAISTASAPPADSACNGTGRYLSDIAIVGGLAKKAGDPLDVNYCLKNFGKVSRFDIYVAVQLPDKTLLYMKAGDFFGTPIFTTSVTPYLRNTLIPDLNGSVLSMPELPLELPQGSYTFYAVAVLTGKSVTNTANWIGTVSKRTITLSW